MLKKIKHIFRQRKKAKDFFTTDLWRFRIKELPPGKSILYKILRIFALAIRGFDKDFCILRASALTFYTVLSIVPVLAMAFGIAKGFGFEAILEKELRERFLFQQEALDRIFVFARDLLEKTEGGLIAGIGVGILFWAVLKVLNHIETSFNQIWKVSSSRSISRKFNDYFAIMLICPLLIIVHSSLSVFITVQVKSIAETYALIGIFSPVIFIFLKMLPYALIWILLSYIYKVLPFTKVKFVSAVAAGILAGTIFQFAQWVYIHFQVGVAQYNAIYGSFAALPLLMIWLQISWMIVLFGAEFSFAYENAGLYEYKTDISNVSHSYKILLYLSIVHLLIQKFSQGKNLPNQAQISEELAIPRLFVRMAVEDLKRAGLISDADCEMESGKVYLPAQDIRYYTVSYVIERLENSGNESVPVEENQSFKEIKEILRDFEEILENSSKNRLLENVGTDSKK